MASLLDGGIAFITGAGSGIGRATGKQFAHYGAKGLVLTDINEAGLQQTKDEIHASYPGVEIETIRMDVTNESSIVAAHKAAIDRFGRIDYAVNNAGTPGHMVASSESTYEQFKFGIDINLFGVWLCQREQLKLMVSQQPNQRGAKGSIVNLSSIYGHTCGKNTTSYCAAKHAVLGMTKSDAANYAKSGIRVNAVCPGFTDTPMIRMPGAGSSVGMDEYLQTCPMGRLGEAREIADVIVFLSSPMASYVTGQDIPVDGVERDISTVSDLKATGL
ncbi:Levodione reductase [Fonsecaea pedrosoi]|nr:Levodione reductase [Fonsecaea pedrosoi]